MKTTHADGILVRAALLAVAAACWVLPCRTASGSQDEPQWSVFAYGGKWTRNRIGEILRTRTRVRNSHVWAAGLSRRVHPFQDVMEDLVMDLEINVAGHSGRQDHFELNMASNLRWTRFPWDHRINTTLSYGLGPSYAFRRPPIETRSRRGATRLLVFMPVELTFAPPGTPASPWEAFFRIHHRSGAFGVVSTARGSNFLTGGLRYRF